MLSSDRTCLVMAKEPGPGRAKTRLARDLGDEMATEVAWSMLDDTLELARAIEDGRTSVWIALPESPSPELATRLEGLSVVEQGPGDLGERLARLLGRAPGDRVVIGSDAPTLRLAHLERAFERLADSSEAVIGPSTDGGYYLLGLRRGLPVEWLAKDIRWSLPTTRAETEAHLRALGVEPVQLGQETDLDDLDDLRRLAASPERLLPRTRGWIERHRSRW